ncbi:unnamed protein product, partial [Sphenostylis stenocarpa]
MALVRKIRDTCENIEGHAKITPDFERIPSYILRKANQNLRTNKSCHHPHCCLGSDNSDIYAFWLDCNIDYPHEGYYQIAQLFALR